MTFHLQYVDIQLAKPSCHFLRLGDERAGVGFIVHPSFRHSVVGFCQATDRMASLKLRIPGGKAVIFSAYAPHSGYEFRRRFDFFTSLSEFVSTRSAHGPKLVLGDMNAKLYGQLDGESDAVGPYIFKHPHQTCKEDANRHLMVEMCENLNMCVANTFFDVPDHNLVTNYNVGTPAGLQIGSSTHSQIDFVLCERTFLRDITGVAARSTPLHYMQTRFRQGWDEEAQKRLMLPQSPEEEEYRKEMAVKHGKRGKEVENLLSRRKEGKRILYEVKWKGLDDAKQNTYESVQKLRLLGVEKMAAALDDRLACAETGLRPLSTREIVKHLEPFGINEDMTTHRMISGFSAGQKSKLMLGASMWTKPHVIPFDEPTNYLDFQTVKSLGRAIQLFRGGTIVVTHNEDFLQATCEEIWHVEDGYVNVQGKNGQIKGLSAKNEQARMAKEKQKAEAKVERDVKAASGPSEAEKALQ
ncbi:unnamed protein product, partial [Prorocentrum cordatum]